MTGLFWAVPTVSTVPLAFAAVAIFLANESAAILLGARGKRLKEQAAYYEAVQLFRFSWIFLPNEPFTSYYNLAVELFTEYGETLFLTGEYEEGEEYFKGSRDFNKCLLEHKIIKKEDDIYKPMPGYEHLFLIDKYRGKEKGIKFTDDFIKWVENWLKKIKPPEQPYLF